MIVIGELLVVTTRPILLTTVQTGLLKILFCQFNILEGQPKDSFDRLSGDFKVLGDW